MNQNNNCYESRKKINKIKSLLLERYGNEEILQSYKDKYNQGLWKSEEILIKRFVPKNSKILDVGCGAGREAIALLKLGYKNIFCIDISSKLIDFLRGIVKREGLPLQTKVADIVDFSSVDKFDCILLLNNVFDQIPDEKRRLRALNNCYKLLKPRGTLILTSHSIFYPGKFGEEWFRWILKFLVFHVKRFLKMEQEELEFGDLFLVERKPIFVHLSRPGRIKQLIKESGFNLVYFNSGKNIEKSRPPNFFIIFHEPLFYVCKKVH